MAISGVSHCTFLPEVYISKLNSAEWDLWIFLSYLYEDLWFSLTCPWEAIQDKLLAYNDAAEKSWISILVTSCLKL